MTRLRICVVGDGLVSGIGDPRGLGWTGRVAARTQVDAGALAMFALGVPEETTSELLSRWRAEAYPRFAADADNRLVVAPGRSDLAAQVSLTRSRLNLANILDDARSDDVRALVVGPVPGADSADHERTGGLSEAFADVCERRDVPFVDCYTPLSQHEQWFADLTVGAYPGQVGYGLIAWLVLHQGWQGWLGVHA